VQVSLEGENSVASFALATTEEIIKKEEVISGAANQGIIKTSLKREKKTLVLSSSDFDEISEWRKAIAAMARRKTLGQK